jgi:hypothetical protein
MQGRKADYYSHSGSIVPITQREGCTIATIVKELTFAKSRGCTAVPSA